MSGSSEVFISKVSVAHVVLEEFEQKLLSFWEMPISKEDLTELDEERCEKLFATKHYWVKDGCYVAPTSWRPEKIYSERGKATIYLKVVYS